MLKIKNTCIPKMYNGVKGVGGWASLMGLLVNFVVELNCLFYNNVFLERYFWLRYTFTNEKISPNITIKVLKKNVIYARFMYVFRITTMSSICQLCSRGKMSSSCYYLRKGLIHFPPEGLVPILLINYNFIYFHEKFFLKIEENFFA